MKNLQLTVSSLALVSAVLFSACGDDTTTVVKTDKAQLAEDLDSLDKCTDKALGSIALVTSTNTIYVCDGSKWIASVVSGNDEPVETGKTEVNFVDSEEDLGKCNSDSKGSLSMVSETGVLYVCNGKAWSASSLKQDPDSVDNSVVDDKDLDPEMIPVSLDTVRGLSQKGPFLTGAEVVVYELENGYSLKQTGNSYRGLIVNDNGSFQVAASTFKSQYAELVAKGSYRNEVSGDVSDGELSLSAVTNLMKRTTVNVNVLTHLEYFRVKYLTVKKDIRVAKAKSVAQSEIFAAFGIDANNFSNSEDLNIAGASDENAALIAVSILLQGDLKSKLLGERLTKFGADIQEDGVWNDSVTMRSIADWAMGKDLNDSLKIFRENIKNWKLSAKVADFEPYVRNYWNMVYGLEKCNDENEGLVMADSVKGTVAYYKGTTDAAKERFVCKSGRWVRASDEEKDTYLWGNGFEGEYKTGSVTGKYYRFKNGLWYTASDFDLDMRLMPAVVHDGDTLRGKETGILYVYDSTGLVSVGWRVASDDEILLGGCGSGNEGYYAEYNLEKFWKCAQHQWVKVDTNEYNTQGWEPGVEGTAKYGGVGLKCYVYHKSLGWKPTENEASCEVGYECSQEHWGKIDQKSYESGYQCRPSNEWVWVYYEFIDDVKNSKCYPIGAVTRGSENPDKKFVCDHMYDDDYVWRETTINEDRLDSVCIATNAGVVMNKFVDGSSLTMTCDTSISDWRKVVYTDLNFEEIRRKSLNNSVTYDSVADPSDATRMYKTVKIGDQWWMAENYNYSDSVKTPNLKGNTTCIFNNEKNCSLVGRYYTWSAAMDFPEKWNKDYVLKSMINSPHRGVCPENWHVPTKRDFNVLCDFLKDNEMDASHLVSEFIGGNNETGFSALQIEDNWYNYGEYAEDSFQTADEGSEGKKNVYLTISVLLEQGSPQGVEFRTNSKGLEMARPLRCIKDAEK